jgi:hypothetical protein
MNNKTRQSQLYSDSVLLFSVQRVSALIINHHQTLIKIRVERTPTDDIEITASQCLGMFDSLKAETV